MTVSNAKAGMPVTVYSVGGFGAKTDRGKLVAIGEVANGNGRKLVRYTPAGKRKEVQNSTKTLLVVVGHGHPDAPKGTVEYDGGERSRYGSFDPRYTTDFNRWARENLTDNLPDGMVLINQREVEGETEPTIDA